MSGPSEQPAGSVPLPVRVLLPNSEEVTGRLWARRQIPEGWMYLVSVVVYRNVGEDEVETWDYQVWLRAQDHLRSVEGVSYADVPVASPPE
ncbi:hypothetical protein ACFQ8C_35435 [Streptomyces sp. NPDC056503]|uniref:hypothetical protein n=1 Tax=Streptomyces sp. NPDC056503 TaxID=3345842 RepID=UPI0036ADBAB4